MGSFALGRTFDVVTCLFSAIGYMRSAEELNEAVATMARHLSPGGVVVIDGWIRAESWRDRGMVQALSGARDGVVATRVVRSYRDGSRTMLDLRHLVGSLDRVDSIVESHELTLFTDDQYRSAFARAELEVEVVTGPHPDRDRYVGRTQR